MFHVPPRPRINFNFSGASVLQSWSAFACWWDRCQRDVQRPHGERQQSENSSGHPTCIKPPNHPTHRLSGQPPCFWRSPSDHPNLKLLKFGFRRVVLLHVLESSHKSCSTYQHLNPSVFSKKKMAMFCLLFFPVVMFVDIFQSHFFSTGFE